MAKKEIIIIMLFPQNQYVQTLSATHLFIDYAKRALSPIFSFVNTNIVLIFTISAVVLAIIKRNFWFWFLSLWFFGGILAMVKYKGVVHDHYLNFLIPCMR